MDRATLIDLLRNKTSLARFSEPEVEHLLDRMAEIGVQVVPPVMPAPAPIVEDEHEALEGGDVG